MRHRCKVTVLATPCDEELQSEYLKDPEAGPCQVFHVGEEFLFENEGYRDDFWYFGQKLDPRFPARRPGTASRASSTPRSRAARPCATGARTSA